ncbi:V-type proton ATPase subunit G [Psidium guajava]|nr:V-type proton ATPase subunit G [Psidium guajava]
MAKRSGNVSLWLEVAPALLLPPFPAPPPRRRKSFGGPGLETIAEEDKEEGDPEAEELEDEAAAGRFRDL